MPHVGQHRVSESGFMGFPETIHDSLDLAPGDGEYQLVILCSPKDPVSTAGQDELTPVALDCAGYCITAVPGTGATDETLSPALIVTDCASLIA